MIRMVVLIPVTRQSVKSMAMVLAALSQCWAISSTSLMLCFDPTPGGGRALVPSKRSQISYTSRL